MVHRSTTLSGKAAAEALDKAQDDGSEQLALVGKKDETPDFADEPFEELE